MSVREGATGWENKYCVNEGGGDRVGKYVQCQ